MKFYLLLDLVLRNMLSHKLRFLFTLLASAIAVGSIIFLFSFAYGIENISTNQLVKSDALMQVEATSLKPTETKLSDQLISQIKSFGEVESVASSTSLAGQITQNDKNLNSPVYAVSENFFTLAPPELTTGHLPKAGDINYILVSQKMANSLGFTNKNILGQDLSYKLIIPSAIQPSTPTPDSPQLLGEVVGVVNDQDSAFAYVDDSQAQLTGATSRSVLKIKVNNQKDIPVIRKKVEDLGLKTTYVGDTLEQMNKFFSYFRLILAGFGGIGIIIAILGMFNTLTVSLMERIREVSLLKTLGGDNRTIFWVFALESLIFGVLGFIVGLILYFFVQLGLTHLFALLASRLNNQPVSILYTPPMLLVSVALATLALTFLIGIFPARRAVKINPLDVQRYE